MKNGVLYLIPNTLGESKPQQVLPEQVSHIVNALSHFIVENEKAGRRFIKLIAPEKAQSSLTLFEINKHTDPSELPSFLEACKNGIDMGLLSDAGCPGVADPGADIVNIAHQNNIKVVPLVGPSSILLALMASGMNGQSFAFNGYLPIEKGDRKHELKRLERLSLEQNQSQICIETPYRNNKFLEDLVAILHNDTLVCVACDITLQTEFIKTKPASAWKNNTEDLHKRPAIFIIHRN